MKPITAKYYHMETTESNTVMCYRVGGKWGLVGFGGWMLMLALREERIELRWISFFYAGRKKINTYFSVMYAMIYVFNVILSFLFRPFVCYAFASDYIARISRTANRMIVGKHKEHRYVEGISHKFYVS